MNVAVNPLQPALDLLREMFPEPKPLTAAARQQIADADKEAAERDQLRAEYVAKRRVELVGRYWRDDAKMDAAIAYAASQVSVGMRLALRNGDDFEFTRLIRARVGVYMHDQAADAAEDEGYVMHPELPL